jgi:hypothetical protein
MVASGERGLAEFYMAVGALHRGKGKSKAMSLLAAIAVNLPGM